ncbi:MAG: hypothetical protein QXT73_01365 [Candidatus Methanomethylicaceae archaeon]
MRRKTSWVAGGLLGVTNAKRSLALQLFEPRKWQAPEWIDNRPYCLPANDQGREPRCAAYAMACLIEARNWRLTHIPRQIDPEPIYRKAKELDGMPKQDGTTLEAVVQAAIELGLLPETTVYKEFKTFDEYCFALHAHGLVLLGFNISDRWYNCSAKTGWIASGGTFVGGHAVAGCWYSRIGQVGVGFQNSWGNWGCNGFGRLILTDYERQIMGGLAIIVP